MKGSVVVCSKCGYQYKIKKLLDSITQNRLEYLVVEHCDECMGLNDLSTYSKVSQTRILINSKRLRQKKGMKF